MASGGAYEDSHAACDGQGAVELGGLAPVSYTFYITELWDSPLGKGTALVLAEGETREIRAAR